MSTEYTPTGALVTDIPTLEVRDLHKAYHGNEVLKGVEFKVRQGQVKAVLGPSGSGKSTMLRLMALLEPADRGEILLEGERIGVTSAGRALPEAKLAVQRREIGMVFQKFNLFPHLTAAKNVALALTAVQKVGRHDALERAHEMLGRVGLADRADHHPSQLSGGQQQRVAIARSLAMEPKLMLFDEPTSALDPELQQEVVKVIKDLAAEHRTMILVTHDMRLAADVSDHVLFLHKGRVEEEGPPEQVFRAPRTDRLRQFLSATMAA